MDVRQIPEALVKRLDDERGVTVLPRETGHSRAQFYRLFRALVEETPAAMRRRLVLERAAWQLGQTSRPVTEIALDAGYESLEAFTRAFRKAYSMSPSLYRRNGVWRNHLPAPNPYHLQHATPVRRSGCLAPPGSAGQRHWLPHGIRSCQQIPGLSNLLP